MRRAPPADPATTGSAAAWLLVATGLADAPGGCFSRADAPPGDTGSASAASLPGRFIGVLPCADCAGIRIELRLHAEHPSGRPTRYESVETYLATRDGDRTIRRAGRWAVLRGSATDRDATVYQLDVDRPETRQNFLRVDDDELRLLDRDQREIVSAAPHSLHRVPDDRSAEPVNLTERDSGRVVDLSRGQSVVIRLRAVRSSGFRWTPAPAAAGVLTALGDATYTRQDAAPGAVGGGGIERWSFVASASGREELRFAYRRPWESGVAPARSLTFAIVVR